jgi:phage protein D
MHPVFRVLADRIDVTAAIAGRLIALAVSDAAGMDGDTAEIVVDDRDARLALPRTGAELAIDMGYRETGLARMGVFVVDEMVLGGPPAQIAIRARAADLRQGLKRPRTRSWDATSIGAIVAAIAAEHGYAAGCAAALAAEAVAHLDQADESDLHFLTRLARERGAVAKPAGKTLLFVPAGEAQSLTGQALPAVVIGRLDDRSTYEATIAERGKYPAVTARYWDPEAAQEVPITVGDGEPVYTIGRRYPDRDAADSAARAKLAAFARGVATLRLTCPGDTRLAAEGRIAVGGIRSGVDGDWTVTRVAHRIDRGGYVCDIEAETTA